MPNNDHPTLSSTALKHYLYLKVVVTHHLDSLQITTSTGILLKFPSSSKHSTSNVLDYHQFNIVKPISYPLLPTIPQANISQVTLLIRSLIHQRLAHCNHRKINQLCHSSTLFGLPRKPLPSCKHQCPICLMSKFSHPPKGPTTNTDHLSPGQLLHIDLVFGTSYLTMVSPACYLLLMLKPTCSGSFAHPIKGHLSKFYPTSSP